VADERITLSEHLAGRRSAMAPAYAGGVAVILSRLADVAAVIERELAHAALRDQLGYAGGTNLTGDQVKKLDLWGHDIVVAALRKTGAVAAVVSEEAPEPVEMYEGKGPHGIVVCIDPVDGSSNLDVNGIVGTIFSLRPSRGLDPAGPAVLGPVGDQLAAGYVMYGPACTLVYSAGDGTHGFTLDRETYTFVLTHPAIRIPADTAEFAINVSNQRRWEAPVQRYISECLAGQDGPRGKDFNMRWVASMVADVFRVLCRGGIFMYPRDAKNTDGRLRLMYEANPMAYIVEQAGGAATDGSTRILDLQPNALHQRVAVILGSKNEVERVTSYHQKK